MTSGEKVAPLSPCPLAPSSTQSEDEPPLPLIKKVNPAKRNLTIPLNKNKVSEQLT
jgi:hypothetical protein